MANDIVSPPGLGRRIAVAAAGVVALVGVTFMVIRNTPAGPSPTRYVNCFGNSGSTVWCVSETGTVNESGSLLVQSGALTLVRKLGYNTGSLLTVDTKGLVYDATNKRVGVNTAAPKAALSTIGTISGSSLVSNVPATAAGKGLCWGTGGSLSFCQSAVVAGGLCSCK